MSKYRKPFYYLFPIVGLNIKTDDSYNDFLFGNTTILNKSEFIDNFMDCSELGNNIQYEVGVIHPDVIDFQNIHKTGKKYIISPNNSFIASKFLKFDEEESNILINRANTIGSFLAFAFLIGSNFENIVSLSKDVYFTSYATTKAIDSQGYNIIESSKMIPEAIHFSLPERPFEFSRSDVKSMLQSDYINPLYHIIIDNNNSNDCKKRLIESLIFFISSINSPNINLQFLGAMISIERMLRNYMQFEKKAYEKIKNRTKRLISDKFNSEYSVDELFQSRHDFVHKEKFPRKEHVIKSIHLASITLIEFANLIHNQNTLDIISYLSKSPKNDLYIFNDWKKHELFSN